MMREGKVIYQEENRVRVVRGEVFDHGDFIEVNRADGRVLLNKSTVLRIENGTPWARTSRDVEPKALDNGEVIATSRDQRFGGDLRVVVWPDN